MSEFLTIGFMLILLSGVLFLPQILFKLEEWALKITKDDE